MKFRNLFLGLATMFSFADWSSAAVITQYSTANSVATSTLPANPALTAVVVASGVAADQMVAGSGLTASSGSTWNWSNWDVASASFAAAVAANDFWQWGFDVTGLDPISLTTMDIRVDRSSTGPGNFEIQASKNGGVAVSLLAVSGLSTNGTVYSGIDLSSLGTVVTGDSVVFTLAAWGSTSTGGTFDLENITFPGGTNGVVINGDIQAVPAPAGLIALLSLGSIGLTRLRRRRTE